MASPGEGAGEQPGLLLTLHRGLKVLEQVGLERGRATAKSLTAALDMNLGTCYQVLRTLQAHGYVQRSTGGHYELGPGVGYLTARFGADLSPPSELVDLLHELHAELGETVYITVRRHLELVIVGVLEGTRVLRVGNLRVGHSGPVNARATAKAYLAHADRDQQDELLDACGFERLTPNTITSRSRFMKELELTRRRGYAIDDEEYMAGVCCIGAVVLDDQARPFGSFGASFPASRLAAEEREIAELVVSAAARASAHMGYDGPYPPGMRRR